MFDRFFERAKKERWLTPHGIYQFFPAQADGDDVLIYDPETPGVVLERFSFPASPKSRICAWQILCVRWNPGKWTMSVFLR